MSWKASIIGITSPITYLHFLWTLFRNCKALGGTINPYSLTEMPSNIISKLAKDQV
jgi:hypothetical protein